jgi:NADH-quinone oxidoreductase subunit M
MLGQVTNGKNLGLPDVSFREIAVFAPLIAWAFWIGIYPKPYFDILRKPVTEIVERVRPEYFKAPVGYPTLPRAGAGGQAAVAQVRSAQ